MIDRSRLPTVRRPSRPVVVLAFANREPQHREVAEAREPRAVESHAHLGPNADARALDGGADYERRERDRRAEVEPSSALEARGGLVVGRTEVEARPADVVGRLGLRGGHDGTMAGEERAREVWG